MKVKVELLADDDSLAVASLFRWLTRDLDVRRRVPVSLETVGPEGAMGALDVINAVLTQATSIASLAVAFASWRESRAKSPSIVVSAHGKSVTIADNSIEHSVALLESLQAAIGPDDSLVEGNPGTAAGDGSASDEQSGEPA